MDILEDNYEICRGIDGNNLFEKIQIYKNEYYSISKKNITFKRFLIDSLSELNKENIQQYIFND